MGQRAFDDSKSAGHLVSRAQRLFAKESDRRLKPLGLSSGYIPVILALAVEPVLTQKGARAVCSDRATDHGSYLGAHGA